MLKTTLLQLSIWVCFIKIKFISRYKLYQFRSQFTSSRSFSERHSEPNASFLPEWCYCKAILGRGSYVLILYAGIQDIMYIGKRLIPNNWDNLLVLFANHLSLPAYKSSLLPAFPSHCSLSLLSKCNCAGFAGEGYMSRPLFLRLTGERAKIPGSGCCYVYARFYGRGKNTGGGGY